MPDPRPSWRLHKTPNPSEKSISLIIPMVEVAEAMEQLDAFVPGMKFRDFPLIPDEKLTETFGNYLFTDSGEAEGPNLSYFFGRNRKEGEESNIKPFRSTWTKFGNHRWCPILKGLAFVYDPHFPNATSIIKDQVQGIATSPRPHVREIFIQEVNEGSRFKLDEFTSPTPFAIGRTPVPQPGSISYDINGISGTIPESLHDDIEIPATNSATSLLVNGSESASDAKVPGQFFPRTNFRRRRPYILAVDQAIVNGIWYMQRLRVFPPRQPRTTVQ